MIYVFFSKMRGKGGENVKCTRYINAIELEYRVNNKKYTAFIPTTLTRVGDIYGIRSDGGSNKIDIEGDIPLYIAPSHIGYDKIIFKIGDEIIRTVESEEMVDKISNDVSSKYW